MKRRLAFAVAALLLGAAGAARADAYDATLTRAIAAKERAMDVNEPARWEEALRLFQEADALRATREASYEIGYAAERLARADLAVEAYEAALDLGLTGQPRAKVQAFIGAHAASLGRLQVRGVAEGRVRSGGVDRGRLPLRRPLVLFPGDVVIEIVEPNNHTTPYRINVIAAHLQILDLSSASFPSSSPSSPSSSPSPSPSPPLPPAPPPDVASPTIILAAPPVPHPASPAAPSPPAPDRGPTADRPVAGWWLVGAGAALIVSGGGMVALSHSRLDTERSDLRDTCDVLNGTDACANAKAGLEKQAQSDVDAIATWKAVRIGSWIGVGAGAVTAGIGVWTLVRGGRPESTPTVAVTDRGVTLGWTGRF
jgi:hypothetical protein